MATFSDLIDSFVDSHELEDMGGEILESNAGYRVKGHELIEIVEGVDRVVAGCESPGTIDVTIWISSSWRGWARERLELKLKRIPLVCFTVMPTEEYDDLGADVLWWGRPIQCMSCLEPLEGEQRLIGLCDECIKLRVNHLGLPEDEPTGGIEQRRGLHGDPLPRRRPSDG